MRKLSSTLGLMILLSFTVTCKRQEPQAEYRPVATIRDLMDSMVDPSADIIWESVATNVTATGKEDKQPRTPEEWAAVRRGAVTLVEATNLLIMPGRHVARPGEMLNNGSEELGPEQIEPLINQDRAEWTKKAHGLHDAAMEALKAVDAKNVQGIFDAGHNIDVACENCHVKYWYPNSAQAADVRKEAEEQEKEKKK